MAEPNSTIAPPRPAHALAWAVFLAMSWTWCIGMFLPVLLLRDLGIGGFIVFAVPNCLGAAAMGWILRDPQHSRNLLRDHHAACVCFSLITILFHAFFAAWIIRPLTGPRAGLILAIVFVCLWLILQWRTTGGFLASIIALAVSLAAIAWAIHDHDLSFMLRPLASIPLPPSDVLWITPVCMFGFLLCPYLDLTFHAARQAMSARESRIAFTLGFCLIFLLMILFTWGYSGWFAIGSRPLNSPFDRLRFPIIALILSAHMIVQSCLTVALHARHLIRPGQPIRAAGFLAFCAALVPMVLLGTSDRGDSVYAGLALGEIVYRCFLGFYGLALPAYVWLCMIPPRRSTLRLAAVIIIAAPLYWLGFIERQTILLVPGVLVPILAKLLPADQASVD